MPKLWNKTIESHRQSVHDATLNAVAKLAGKHGLLGLTMSHIAETAGIGRATLYKYYPDIKSILAAWHERQVARHLGELRDLARQDRRPDARLAAILETYAQIAADTRAHGELAAFLHRDGKVAGAQAELRAIIRAVIEDGVQSKLFRDDVGTAELAAYCLHAVAAAGNFKTKPAQRQLVAVILAGLAAE